MSLRTHAVVLDRCSVVAVEGELDLATAEQLWEKLAAVLAEHDGPLVLDLADLEFCDSVGLSILVRVHNALHARGQGLVVARPTAMVERVLAVSGLNRAIRVESELDAATALAACPPPSDLRSEGLSDR